jgi:lipoprotein signal peptidase
MALPITVMVGVVAVDQVTKAVQHANHFVVNTGGAALVPSAIGDFLWRSPHIGAVVDTAAVAALCAVARLIPAIAGAIGRVGAAMMVGGLSSNLLDRLGFASLLHAGLPRGSIDWVPLGSHLHANVADGFVALGAALIVANALRHWRLRRTTQVATLIALLIWTMVWGSNRCAASRHRQEVVAAAQLSALCRAADRYPSTGMDWLSWDRPPAAYSPKVSDCDSADGAR